MTEVDTCGMECGVYSRWKLKLCHCHHLTAVLVECDVTTSIRISWLRGTGHVERMSGEERVMDCKPE